MVELNKYIILEAIGALYRELNDAAENSAINLGKDHPYTTNKKQDAEYISKLYEVIDEMEDGSAITLVIRQLMM